MGCDHFHSGAKCSTRHMAENDEVKKQRPQRDSGQNAMNKRQYLSFGFESISVFGSYRKAVVVPPTVATSKLALDGEVTGGLLRPIPPSTSFPPAAVLLV